MTKIKEIPHMEADGFNEAGGFGASLGLHENDIHASELYEKSDAQVMLETAQDALRNAGENIWNKGVEIFGRCKAWAEKKFDTIRTVTAEWADDVIETVQLKTVDKWRLLNSQGNNNKLINRREKEIENLGYKAENERRNIGTFNANKATETSKFQVSLDNMKDPVLREIFQRNLDEKTKDWNAKIEASEQKIAESVQRQEKCNEEIVSFRSDIEIAGNNFSDKIDSRIKSIYERTGYEQKNADMRVLAEQIDLAKGSLSEIDANIETYSNALTNAKELGIAKADIDSIKSKIKSLKAEKKLTESSVARADKAHTKLRDQISQIEERTKKWQTLREKMGLSKPASGSEQLAEIIENTDAEIEALQTTETEVHDDNEGESGSAENNDEVAESIEAEASQTELSPEEVNQQDQDQEQNTEASEDLVTDDHSESNEANAEQVDSSENKEGMEKLSKYFGELYKMTTMVTPTAAEMFGKLKDAEPLIEEFAGMFDEDGEKVVEAIKGVIADYTSKGDIEPFKQKLKIDIVRKIIGKLPDSIEF